MEAKLIRKYASQPSHNIAFRILKKISDRYPKGSAFKSDRFEPDHE